MVRAVLPGIALRGDPALSAERLGALPEGSRSFVVSDPVVADGYTWIELAGPGLPPASGCPTFPGPEFSCPIWHGWAATGDPQTGQAWFVDDPTTNCPDPALDTGAFMMLGDVEALHCYGNQDIRFTGWLPGNEGISDLAGCVGKDVGAKWLWCSEEYALRVWASNSEEVYIDVFVDPKTRRQLAYPGHWPIVVGHFDDPAASECDAATPDGWPMDPDAVSTMCRSHFVLTLLGGVGP